MNPAEVALPLADEIRAARRAVKESSDAQRMLREVAVAEQLWAVLQAQQRANPEIDVEAPGGDLVDAWLDDPALRMPERRAEALGLVRALIQPLADLSGARNQTLKGLVEAQRERMSAPEFHSTLERLQVLSEERREAWRVLEPVIQRQAILQPSLDGIAKFLLLIEDFARESEQGVPSHCFDLVNQGIEMFGSTFAVVSFEVALPEPAIDEPTYVEAVSRLRTLCGILKDEIATLGERHQSLSARYEEVSARIASLTG